MRISDWSSDVCSSDLAEEGEAAPARAGILDRARRGDLAHMAARQGHARRDARAARRRLGRDRKSVVEGKSVSVRVDLGGRRSIKKKKNISDKIYIEETRKATKKTILRQN